MENDQPGNEGQIKPKDQVCTLTLHIYVDELDVAMAKPLLMVHYKSWPSANHVFPGIWNFRMNLVPEINSVLDTKGRKNCGQTLGMPKHLEQDKTSLHQDVAN